MRTHSTLFICSHIIFLVQRSTFVAEREDSLSQLTYGLHSHTQNDFVSMYLNSNRREPNERTSHGGKTRA